MDTMQLTINPLTRAKRITVELDADRLERLAANFGMFNPDFVRSLEQSEKDIKNGRIKKLRSLKDLRN